MRIFMLSCLCVVFFQASFSQGLREEFNGPFNSWANVKTRFHAQGDGIADDTRALQTALDSLSCTLLVDFNNNPATRYVVMYLPAGTYKISQTLKLAGKIGVTIIGEDPLKTVIQWSGGDNDTMLHANRSAYFKISRLTWNAGEKQNIEAIGLHYKDTEQPNFAPTTIEFSDMIFAGNVTYGIAGGTYGEGTGAMDAEVTIKRCKFYSALGAGIFIKGYNALDYWIWDCSFEDCAIGIDCRSGNYHVYRSSFLNSTVSDIHNRDVPYSSVRGCFSTNAQVFSIDEGAGCGPFKRTFQGNYVLNSKSIPIDYHHQGKITLFDNTFNNVPSATAFAVNYTSWCPGSYDMVSVNNQFTESTGVHIDKAYASRLHAIEDKKVNFKIIKKPVVATPEPFVPYVKRIIFEIPIGADQRAIQDTINKAALLKGQRAIVHFPMGDYFLNQSLVIPGGSDIQLIGDGIIGSTVFKKAPDAKATLEYFQIKGPSYVTIRDFQVGKDGDVDNANAFVFAQTDQISSQVHMDQIYSSCYYSMYIDRYNYTYFEKNNSFFSKTTHVIGGPRVQAGTGTSRLHFFGGQSAGVHLENNATMVAKDCWWEGKAKRDFLPINLTGSGNLTVDGAMYAPTDQDSGVIVNIADFKGKVSLLNMYLIGSIAVNPNSPNLKMLVWNINMYHKKDPLQFLQTPTSAKIAMMGITSQCFSKFDPTCANEMPVVVADGSANITDMNGFISDLTADDRKAMPKPFVNLRAGVSNINISRVCTYNGNVGYYFKK